MSLDPAKHAKLEAFLAALPDRHARQLMEACAAAEARGDAGLPFDLMRDALSRRQAVALRNAFGAAWPLLTEDAGPKTPGRILFSSLEAAARLAQSRAAEVYDKLAAGAPPVAARRERLGREFRAFLEAEDGKKSIAETELGGGRALADLREITALLCAEPELSDSLAGFPETIENLNEVLLGRVRDLFEVLGAKDAEAPLLMLFLLLERLEKRAQILRVLKKLVGQEDDLMATQTDVAAIGDQLLDDAEAAVAATEPPVHAAPDGPGVVEAVARFSSISRGMTRELGIRRDGRWGKRLKDLRNLAARNLEELCRIAPDAIEASLPQERIRLQGGAPATRPAVAQPPREETFARGLNYAIILGGVRDYASACAFAAAHGKACEAAERVVDEYCDGLLALVADADEGGREALDPWIAAAEQVTTHLVDERAASVLRRRIAAALPAGDEAQVA